MSQYHPKKKTSFKSCLSSVAYVIGGIICISVVIAFFENFGTGSLMVLMVGGCVGTCIYNIIKRNRQNIIISLCLLGSFGLIYLGVLFDFPQFLRKIPGQDFMRGILFYIAGVTLLTFLAHTVGLRRFAEHKAKEAGEKIYSDSDLLILQGADRFQLVGYYLCKARLHNIIRYRMYPGPEEDDDSTVLLDINPDVDPATREQYCKDNPQVARIVEFIEQHKNIEKSKNALPSLLDALSGVHPTPVIQSEGGIFAVTCFQQLQRIWRMIWLIGISLIAYPCVTKLLMGLHNQKPSTNLQWLTLLVGGIAIGLYRTRNRELKQTIRRIFVSPLIKIKAKPFENIPRLLQKTDFNSTAHTNEEITHLLRAYAVYDYSTVDYLHANKKTDFSAAIFSAAAGLRYAFLEANKISYDSDGCGGCSGCSGCGGGCGGCGGGCGGCGD